MTEIDSRRKIIGILLLSTVALIIYLISIQLAYPVFQNTRLIDPLAEMHSLVPLYYVAIALMAIAGFACFAWRIGNRKIHLVLLLLFAIMLWYTPYFMAGFSRLPDTAKNIGIAMNVPQILAGDVNPFSWYCATYPSSYVYSWSFINITGMETIQYMRFFPLICICMFVLLCYAFVSKLFNPKVAFLAMLLAIPGLHYITSHASAHSIGVLLLLTTLILLFHKGIIFRILTFIAIIAVFICHPISPLLLSIFLVAALITSYSGRIGKTQLVIAMMLVVCFAGWFFWPNVSLITEDAQSISPVARSEASIAQGTRPSELGQADDAGEQAAMIYKRVTPDEFSTTRKYLIGTPFIYGNIHRLNVLIYMLYAMATAIAILGVFYREYLHGRKMKNWLLKTGGLNRNQLFLILSGVMLFVLTVLLAEKGHVLIERGLTFIIICCSCITASVIVYLYRVNKIRRIIIPVMGLLTVFLTLAYPVVAYSIEAFTNFPASEDAGLQFLASDVLSEEKTLTITSSQQLTLYTLNINLVRPPRNDISKGAEVVVFRSTGFFNNAMRQDMSFKDNEFIRYQKDVDDCSSYNRIYVSHSTCIYNLEDV